jgi:DNA-binding MarR family transcriptional regulator
MTMADYESLLDAVARIQRACGPRYAQDPEGGMRVSAHQGRVLGFLDERDPTMVGELADHLGVTASTMSLTLTRLEGAGYVRRDRDPLDRRVANVRLTEAGVRARDAFRELDPARIGRMLDLLDPAQRRDVLRALALLGGVADRLHRREREGIEAQL